MTPRSYSFFLDTKDLSTRGSDVFSCLMDASKFVEKELGSPRTMRVTLPPISLDFTEDFEVDLALVDHWYKKATEIGIRWVNQPFRISSKTKLDPHLIQVLTNYLVKRDRLFASINVQNIVAVQSGAQIYSLICKSLSRYDSTGFSNLRVGVGCRINNYTPFFPFSDGQKSGLSIALESLPLVREEWMQTHSYASITNRLVEEVETITAKISGNMKQFGLGYYGADWSLAPLPNGSESVVALIEQISGNPLGGSGSLSVISKITECLKGPISRMGPDIATGFNGVMLSVLEDDVLAKRFLHRDVSVNDLLLYSTVCGCGLDMIPITGDTPEQSISEYSADTGNLAFRLDKPLGVRFLPVSRLKEGQKTNYNHDFVNNSGVVRL